MPMAGGAPLLQLLDGFIQLLPMAEGQVYLPVGQLGLVQDDEVLFIRAEADMVHSLHGGSPSEACLNLCYHTEKRL